MAEPAPNEARLFPRGTNVLDYWLAHAEGFVVYPLGARVEQVVAAPDGRAAGLVIRSRAGRRRTIDAAAVAGVDPAAQVLVLARHRSPVSLPAAARRTAHAARRTSTARASAVLTWTRPHAASLSIAARSAGAAGARAAFAAGRWLAPRVADATAVALIVATRLVAFAIRGVVGSASVAVRDVRRPRGPRYPSGY
ncbi:MAG TPA: hypothetical protein VFA05_10570 [Gaiellaceae bacterium]|nr:hypothetical protein [Gaiellaceae bacterium]